MVDVLAFIDDLFFQAKLLETAKQLGVEFRACCTLDALKSELTRSAPNLAIVDLNAKSDPFAAIEQLKLQTPTVPVIAFVSHVQLDLIERARAAGCEVMPRSKFTRELATILARAKSHQ